MKALVLGGNGFMGSHLSRALADAGHQVRIFDRPDSIKYFSSSPDVEYVYGDFSQYADVERALAGCEIVFHLLSTTLPQSSNEDPIFDLNSNLIASVQMLNIAHRSKVKKIIFEPVSRRKRSCRQLDIQQLSATFDPQDKRFVLLQKIISVKKTTSVLERDVV